MQTYRGQKCFISVVVLEVSLVAHSLVCPVCSPLGLLLKCVVLSHSWLLSCLNGVMKALNTISPIPHGCGSREQQMGWGAEVLLAKTIGSSL